MNAIVQIQARPLSQEQRDKAIAVIERIEQHGNMSKACREAGIEQTTLFGWMERDVSLEQRYARARKIGTLSLVDGAFEKTTDPDLKPQDVMRARLAWDATKWYASKQDPDTFGDKIRTEHTGANGGAIAVETTERSALASELAAFMRQAKRPGSAGVTIDAKPIDDISDLI